MKLLIYRTSTGKKYPAILLRLVIVTLLVLLSLIMVQGSIKSTDFSLALLIRWFFYFVLQELVLQLVLRNGHYIYDGSQRWKFFVIQIVFGIILPTIILLQCKIWFYDLSRLDTSEDPMLINERILFHPRAIVILNILYMTCAIAQTEYTKIITFEDQFGAKIFDSKEIDMIIDTSEDVIFSTKGTWFTTKSTADLKKKFANLNPITFKCMGEGIFLNRNLFSSPEDNGQKALLKQIQRMTFEVISQAQHERMKQVIANFQERNKN